IVISFADGGGSLVMPSMLLEKTGSEAGALLAQMLVSGVYGAIPMGGAIVYEFDSWGLLKQAVVHYVNYTAAFLLIGSLVGWVETPLEMALMAGVFLVGHCIIWLVMYVRFKAATDELNELLQEAKQSA
ncbi:MAG: DUF3021 domain-containing protein, partial [Atopobiaceae bacterium]|nr:DUF3021 domain-containing protein [Atopobiaceae bacterium]